MRYLLDSTVLIDHGRGRPSVLALLELLLSEPNELYTCDVVVTEALSGGTDDERQVIQALVRVLEYVSTRPDAAVWAADARRVGRAHSNPRSLADALIGGVAWSLDAAVVTRNVRDFEKLGVPVLGYA
ncbi:MAG: type II toxin-antitoxin system VapC family toxin [Candidatus Limnocylindrales bacterium]